MSPDAALPFFWGGERDGIAKELWALLENF